MDYLPIGSVVRIAGIEKKLIVAGIFQYEQGGDGQFHDYLGVPYPEGFLGPGMNFLFDEKDIEEVVFRGYEDEERTNLIMLLDIIKSAQEQGADLAALVETAIASDAAARA